MGKFNQEEFRDYFVEHARFRFESMTSTNDIPLNWYCECDPLQDFDERISRVAGFVFDLCEDHGIVPEYFLACPDGTVKLADYLNSRMRERFPRERPYKAVLTRAAPKRGTYFVGPVDVGDMAVVVEDVTTSGLSVARIVKRCQERRIDLLGVVCLMDRQQRGLDKKTPHDVLGELGVRLYPMLNAEDVLPLAYRKLQPGEAVARMIEQEYESFGTVPIKLR